MTKPQWTRNISLIRCLALLVAVLVFAAPAASSLRVTGTSGDVETFLDMLEACLCRELGLDSGGNVFIASAAVFSIDAEAEVKPVEPGETWEGTSESLMQLLEDIINGNFSVNIDVGRSQPGVLIDAFGGDGNGTVDVGDLEALPETAPSDSPNCSNRCQNIAHFMAEYKKAATNGIPAGPPPHRADFNDSHPVPENPAAPDTGIGAENSHRQGLGQSTTVTGSPGTAVGLEIQYSDGTAEVWHVDANGNITAIECP